MYECEVCKQQITLTDEQHNLIAEDQEINIKCSCGNLNIMVGADYDPELDGYNVYSYDVK